MDLSRTFTAPSELQPGTEYTFRRLTVAERARLDLDIGSATRQQAREREQLIAEIGPQPPMVDADGKKRELTAAEQRLQVFDYLLWLSVEAPLVLKSALLSVTGYMTPTAFVDNPDTPRELIEEAYALGMKGIRMNAQQLGEWLSRGTSPQAGPAGATSSTAPSVSGPDGTARGAVGDTSPIA